MAADHDEIRHRNLASDQRDLDRRPGLDELRVAVDSDEAVGATEARHAAASLAHRIGGQATLLVLDESDEQIFQPAAFTLRLDRQPGGSGLAVFVRMPGEIAEQGRHELVEREDRRGRKAGQDHDGLLSLGGETDRLAGLERHAVHQDPGVELADDDRVQIALALGGATREQHHVGVLERVAQRRAQRGQVVPKGTTKARLTAQLANGVGQDATVAVEDEARPHRLSGLDDLVTGREDRDARPAHALDPLAADRREHTRLPRGEPGACKEHGLTATHVGSREAHGGARHPGRAHQHVARVFGIDVRHLDRRDRIRASRQHAAGGNRRGGSLRHLDLRLDPGREDLVVEPQPDRLLLGATKGIRRAHSEPVHVRAVEARHVDRRAHVLGQDSAERVFERDRLGSQRRAADDGPPARLRLVAIEHLEKLGLRSAHALSEGVWSGASSSYRNTSTDVPSGMPSSSRGTMTAPAARTVEDRIEAPAVASGVALPCSIATRT